LVGNYRAALLRYKEASDCFQSASTREEAVKAHLAAMAALDAAGGYGRAINRSLGEPGEDKAVLDLREKQERLMQFWK
jgi:hypothetical protein